MLIDAFVENWLDTLCRRAMDHPSSRRMYLLLDGAFVPGLHRRLRKECKAILFAARLGCSEEAVDASPFLTPFAPEDKGLRSLLQRCNGWPMVSVIETPESLEQLADRLAAWCIVEADDQRFNFRFPDTRRLPAIFDALSQAQRAKITGPALYWSFIGRDGHWHELELAGRDMNIVAEPALDQRQFTFLVDDSAVDEMLGRLGDRGVNVFKCPSRSHALVMIALRMARITQLPEDTVLDWCGWFWSQDYLHDDSGALSLLNRWRIGLWEED